VERETEPVLGKGYGTLWLSQQKKGDKLDLLGPLGNGFTVDSGSRNLLLVAGGIGIAPLVFLAERAKSQGKSVRLLLGARTAKGLYPNGLLPKGIEVELVTEDGSLGGKGMVSEYVISHLDWADQVYACGPKAMYESIAREMSERRVSKPVQVSLEVRMGCGMGACYGCSIPTKQGMKRVCLDGPVFDLNEVLLQEVRL
jgi:dihydroorotate dehydrogenase electron transfer subunit